MKKISKFIFPILLTPMIVFAAGKAVAPSSNQQAVPIAGVNSSGVMVPILTDSDGVLQVSGGGGGSGTVTSVSVTTANGVSGTVANATTTPALTLSLGAITPSTVQSTGKISAGGTDTMTINGVLLDSQLQAHSDTAAIIESHTHSDTAGLGAILYGARSRGTGASPSVVQSGDVLSYTAALGYDGTDFAIGGYSLFSTDATPSSNDMPTAWGIYLSPDGSQTPAAALTISSAKDAVFAGSLTTNSISQSGLSTFSAGAAISAASYQCGRDNDGTNQIHCNVPTGATFEQSVNDVSEYVYSATDADWNSNTLSNLGSTGTDFVTGGGLNIGPSVTSAGIPALTITQAAHTGLTAVKPSLNVASFTNTLANAATLSVGYGAIVSPPTYQGVAGGGTETVTDITALYLPGSGIAGSNLTSTNQSTLLIGAGTFKTSGRVVEAQGADVASANNLTLGADGNNFEITGTTQINAITTTGWGLGSRITLIFTSTPTVKHNTAGGANTAVMLLSGAGDFSATAGDTLTLVYSEQGGTNAWREVSRTVI